MKKALFLLTTILISLKGYSDTIDYWHVYLNDELLAEFNMYSKDLTVKLTLSNLKNSDTITVRYGTDQPCIDCIYGLTVTADIMEKLPTAETTDFFGKLSIPIRDLLYLKNKYQMNKFHLRYYERNRNGMRYENSVQVATIIL